MYGCFQSQHLECLVTLSESLDRDIMSNTVKSVTILNKVTHHSPSFEHPLELSIHSYYKI